jgi:hypothetical protein
MSYFIVLMIVLSLWVSTAPFAHPETLKSDSGSASARTSEIGRLLDAGTAQALETTAEEIGHPIVTMRKTAEVAARTVGKSLGQYIRGKVQHQKNMELLQRFDNALYESLLGLRLTMPERQKLVRSIERAYIEDADSGKNQLDQFNFYDLPQLVKKEYAQIELERTEQGTVDTFNERGKLKTRWTMVEGKPEGPAITYYEDGEIKYIDIYQQGRRISRKKYNRDGQMVFEQNYSYEAVKPAEKAEVVEEIKTPVKSIEPENSAQETSDPEPAAVPTQDDSDASIEFAFKEIQPLNP